MHEIKCPHCHEEFAISETDYMLILNQVKNDTFDEEVEKRVKEKEAILQSKLDMKLVEAEKKSAQKTEKELQKLREKLSKSEVETNTLQSELNIINEKHNIEIDLLRTKQASTMKETINDIETKHKTEIQLLQEELDHYKDFKAKSSTKMIGESLEQHCMDEFDKLRATAFTNDYFEKDNVISETGSKGDFIYRAYDDNGNEIVSIMFEMKNEMETTSSNQKHKNTDFLKELDKDRREKNCEYAVLCSLLEADSELYNQGIVDVSHKYSKMYVIRPQFFITIISLLRNAAKSQISLKNELAAAQQTNIDIVNLEQQIDAFKTMFGKNYDLASRKFDETISEIDKAIVHLQKTKDALTSCTRNLRLANEKSSDLSVKKLLKDSPNLLQQYNM